MTAPIAPSSPARPGSWVVRGEDVQDSTADPAFVPVIVTARLAEPVVTVADPIHLDGPLSWGVYLAARDAGIVLPPLREDRPAMDFALPLAIWTAPAPPTAHPSTLTTDGWVWGWACSRALWAPVGWTAAHTRKNPPVNQLARFTRDAKYHAALGPHKARNAAHQAVLCDRIVWHALAKPDQLVEALLRLKAIGRLTRHGWGRFLRIDVAPGADRDAWTDRAWPDPDGAPATIRAPYWHPLRRMSCSSTRPA